MISSYLRFKDLQENGVVNNWTTLRRWIKAGHFPPGRMIGPNSRAWTEYEIEAHQQRLDANVDWSAQASTTAACTKSQADG